MSKFLPVRKTVNVPHDLWPLIERRIDEEKYHSISDYFIGLAIFDAFCRRKHKLTGELLREPQKVIDKVIEQLVRDFDDPAVKRPGGWFEARIDELVAQEKTKAQAAGENEGG